MPDGMGFFSKKILRERTEIPMALINFTPGQENPYYPAFIKHPFIQTIASTKKWTTSTNDKMPIDMERLIYRQEIRGAKKPEFPFLQDLFTLHAVLSDARSFTYYLDAEIDRFLVLDIEPSCPKEIKEKLCHAEAIYRETSMSGKGIHLIFPYPEALHQKYPKSLAKVAFKEPHGYYEILLNHYVTFTARQLPEPNETDPDLFVNLFADMASQQKTTVKQDIDLELIDEPIDVPGSDLVYHQLRFVAGRYPKTPEDFNGDLSRYEFAFLFELYRAMDNMVHLPNIQKDHDYTIDEYAAILYQIASETLPKREKHNTTRNGYPWLFYVAQQVIATDLASKEEKWKKRKEKGEYRHAADD